MSGSVFPRALGEEFTRLHPEMQRRFGVGVAANYGCIGRGVMSRVRRGPWWTIPFLLLGTTRNIMFPENAMNVPFRIDNHAYIDEFGRETVTFVRTMQVGARRRRRFDATMIYSAQRGRVVDYLGTHQHLAVDLDLSVTPDGGLRLVSGEQRFYEGKVAFRFPAVLTGRAILTEYFDDATQQFVVDLEVHNRLFGFLFGYRGTFECEYPEPSDLVDVVRPLREEERE